jgi:hypothetical protein
MRIREAQKDRDPTDPDPDPDSDPDADPQHCVFVLFITEFKIPSLGTYMDRKKSPARYLRFKLAFLFFGKFDNKIIIYIKSSLFPKD